MTGKINKTEFDGYNQHAKFDFLLQVGQYYASPLCPLT